jgi:hypothetical protein
MIKSIYLSPILAPAYGVSATVTVLTDPELTTLSLGILIAPISLAPYFKLYTLEYVGEGTSDILTTALAFPVDMLSDRSLMELVNSSLVAYVSLTRFPAASYSAAKYLTSP